jgi:iron(III) transport system substrate-binding protein
VTATFATKTQGWGSRTFRWLLPVIGAAVLLSGWAVAQRGPVVYAIINEQDALALTDLFRQKTGLEATLLRGSTGEIVSRVIAEQRNPQADIVLGGPSTLHIVLKEEGALEPYLAPGAAEQPAGTFDPEGYWTGWHLTALGIGINTERFAQRYGEKPYPATWDDLLDPGYRGEIVVTDPVASSTAYLFVQLQLQRLGWDAGWDYLAQLVPLVGQFPSSGSAPTQLLGAGEYTLGVSYIHALARNINAGLPIALVVPPETTGEVGAVSIIQGGPNTAAAKQFVDFLLGAEAQQLFTDISLTTPVNPDVVLPAGAVSVDAVAMIDFDPVLAAEQRDEVLELWVELVD